MAELRLGENIVIPAIVVGGDKIRNQDKTITQNGVYTADDGFTGLGEVTVNVPIRNQDKTITQNGQYSADDGYAGLGKVTVSVPVSRYNMTIFDMTGDVDESGEYIVPANVSPVFLGIKTISSSYAMSMAYSHKVVSVEFPDLESVTGDRALQYCFYTCTKLASASFPALRELGAYALYYCFYQCVALKHVDMPLLTEITGSAMDSCFYGCGIESIDFPSLTTITGSYAMYQCFRGCRQLKRASFPVLATIENTGTNAMSYCFEGCSSLESMSFPALTTVSTWSVFTNCFMSCPALVEIHFRADMQSVIEAMPGYSSKFGATNATIYFDL